MLARGVASNSPALSLPTCCWSTLENGVVLPAVGACQVEAGAPGIVAFGIAAAHQDAAPAMRSRFTAQFEFGLLRRRASQHVDRAADGIGAVQGAARAFHDFDATRMGDVDSVQRIVVEKPRRTSC